MSSGRDSRWSPSLISVSTTSSRAKRATSSTACRHGTSGSCTPCRICTGHPVSISPPSSRCLRPSQYSEAPYPITKGLIEAGRKHLLLGGLSETGCPVHILQGVQDPDVPWRHAVELVARFARDDVVLTLIKDGDHRLSRPEDLERLIAAVREF